ncbi:MAG: DUF1365 domain-containing protein [Puniceicoccaceae bacterium]
MEVNPQVLYSTVMHKRLFPKENSFSYKVYTMAFDLDAIDSLSDGIFFGVDRWGLASFHRKDHGSGDGSCLKSWALSLLKDNAPEIEVNRIVLIAMPRILGYGFNPVSFWLCLDKDENLRCVIAEVHNTFGERHVYLCSEADGGVLDRSSRIEARKVFHVSPFLERNGHYSFRFAPSQGRFGVWIDYHAEDGRKQLLTSMSGEYKEATRLQRLSAFIKCPLVTIKTIVMIHWQALRLFAKGIQVIRKPAQLDERIVLSEKLRES